MVVEILNDVSRDLTHKVDGLDTWKGITSLGMLESEL